MPKVSVIIPSYNHEKFVAVAIQSVLDQTYQDFEIIIVDDGSMDGTVSEIRKFDDSRIRLHCFEKNYGACLAANKCIELSTGKYIAMLSSDDIFFPEKLATQVKFLDEHPYVGAVFSKAEIINENGESFEDKDHFYCRVFEQPNRTRYEWLNHFFYSGNCLCHPSVLIRKVCYNDIGTYDPRLAQLPDLDFWIRLCFRYDIHILPDKLIKFRVRNNEMNSSGNRPEVRMRSQLEWFIVLQNYLQIKSVEDYKRVFDMNQDNLTEKVIPFLIARNAFDVDNNAQKLFALDTIYNFLREEGAAQEIIAKFSFDYADFIKLTGQYDFFSLLPYSSSLYYDIGNGYCEQQKITRKVDIRQSQFVLTFDVPLSAKAVRWDPIEDKIIKIRIEKIYCVNIDNSSSEIDIHSISSNGYGTEYGTEFETTDPFFIIPLEGEVRSITINGIWKFIDTGNIIQELNSTVQALNNVYNSKSWKITKPLRWIQSKLRNK